MAEYFFRFPVVFFIPVDPRASPAEKAFLAGDEKGFSGIKTLSGGLRPFIEVISGLKNSLSQGFTQRGYVVRPEK